MNDYSANPGIAFWHRKVEASARIKQTFDYDWKEGMRYFKGTHWGDKFSSGSDAGWGLTAGTTPPERQMDGQATVPLMWSLVQTLLPHLFFRNPEIVSTSRREDPQVALFAESVAKFGNYVQKEMDKKGANRLALTEALIKGAGFTWTDFDSVRGLPRTKWISADDVFVDPDCKGDLKSAKWMARRLWMRVDEILANPIFRGTEGLLDRHHAYSDVSADERKDIRGEMYGSAFDKECVWEIWSKEGTHPFLRPAVTSRGVDARKAGMGEVPEPEGDEETLTENVVLAFVEGHDKWLRRDPWPIQLDWDEFPLTMLRINDVPNDFWGVSDFTVLRPLQKYIDWISTFSFWHAKKTATGKGLYDQNKLSRKDAKRLANARDMEMIPVTGDPTNVIRPVEWPAIHRDIDATVSLAKSQFDEISGASELVRGGERSGDQTATEAKIEDARAQQRFSGKLDKVEDFSREQVRKEIQIALQLVPAYSQVHLDGHKVPGVDFFLGPQCAAYWAPFEGMDPEAIRAEVLLDIEPGSTRKTNKEEKRQEVLAFWQVFSPFLLQAGAIPQAVAAYNMAVRAHEFANGESLLLDPAAMQMAMAPPMGGPEQGPPGEAPPPEQQGQPMLEPGPDAAEMPMMPDLATLLSQRGMNGGFGS